MLSIVLPFLCLVLSALSKTVNYDWSIDWVTASPDGFSRPVVGINGQWPCPQIDINKGDRLIVQVHNNLGNESTSLHWHGLSQRGSVTMDGTTGVSQCPIPPGSSFTYNFKVFAPHVAQSYFLLTIQGGSIGDILVPFAYSRAISRWLARADHCPRSQSRLPLRRGNHHDNVRLVSSPDAGATQFLRIVCKCQ